MAIVAVGILCLFNAALLVHAEPKSHPITTQLSAKWGITPAQLEIAEFIDEESANSFWDYVELLNNVPDGLYRFGKHLGRAEQILPHKG